MKRRELALEKKESELRKKELKQDSVVQVANSGKSNTSNPEEAVLEIRAEFKRINSLPLTKRSFNYEAPGCANEGFIEYYLDGNEVVKIVEGGWIGDGNWTSEYYYKDGKFFFSHEVFAGGPANGPETRTEYRTYVKNNRIVRKMENKNIIDVDRGELTPSSKEYRILKAYTKRDFVKVLCDSN